MREASSNVPKHEPLAELNWTPVFSQPPSEQKEWPDSSIPLVGRFAPAAPDYWPTDIAQLLEFYPVCDDLDIRLLGVPQRLLGLFSGRLPSNWVVFTDGWISVNRFMRAIDYFLIPRDAKWPYTPVDWRTLWAMSRGIIPVLPSELSNDFGDAAMYAEGATRIREVIGLHHRDPGQFLAQTRRTHEYAVDHCGAQIHLDRLRAAVGKPRRRVVHTPGTRPSRFESTKSARLLFLATNGIGLGHLTQLLAIARKLPSSITPIFVTNSQAISVVRRYGYVVHYLPDDKYTKVHTGHWNDWLARELDLLTSLYDAKGIVFDGVWCFNGLFQAAARRPEFAMVWVRIPMWKRVVWDESTERAKYFDLTIDVGELAQTRNRGARITYARRSVAPVVLCDESEILDRSSAREALGLPSDELVVMLQLGAGNNWALQPVIAHVCTMLRKHGVTQIVNAEWLIADQPAHFPGVRCLRAFPIARYLAAFDFVLSAVGYNAFHEQIAYGVPTVFFPNENMSTDDQLGRAIFAEETGLGYCVPENELDKFEEVLVQLLDPAVRERIRNNCILAFPGNGADEAARLITEQIASELPGITIEPAALPVEEGTSKPAYV
jgi:UDP:flavonoid glycosyltransferase YjiC (YdhE family)